MRRVLLSAGDPSGDTLLAGVISELKALYNNQIEFVGLAGPLCEAQGAKIIAQSKDVAVVGFVEVIRNLRKIFGVLARLGDEVPNVDSVLCVDFPDFNFKLAEIARRKKKPVDYIVPPQVWVWRQERKSIIANLFRRVYTAFPFEESLLREAGVNARFLGHPLRDRFPPRNRREGREALGVHDDEFLLGVLPGSRRSEVKRHLPLLMDAWELFTKFPENYGLRGKTPRAVLPLAPGWTRQRLLDLLRESDCERLSDLFDSGAWILTENSYTAMMGADFAWIVSGTATLEAAFYQLPHILIYKLSPLSALLIRSMTSYFERPDGFAGLPNILLGKRVIPELLQGGLSPRRLAVETRELLSDSTAMSHMRRELRWFPKKLGETGSAKRIAEDLKNVWDGGRV